MKRNPARRVRGMVLSAILLAAWAPSALAIVPEGGAREGGTGASLASQGDGSAPARSWGQSLATLARALTPSLLALLALGDPVEAAAASQAQTVTNPFANLTQGVNLSGTDTVSALATLDGAQMYQVYYLMVSTANQLLATAFLLPAGSPAAIALNYAGTQLISMADIAGSLGAQGQILAAQATLSSLLQPPQANQPPRGFASASGALPTVLPDGFLYGTWQIIPTLPNGGQLFYRFSLGLASRISVTTEHDGEEVVEIANLAGPVSTLVRYRLTPGPQALEAAQASGAIQVVLRVPGPGATPRTVVFTYFRRPLVPGDPSVIAEVLTDTEADQAFFRLPPETEA